jgi:hypothetical protein
MSVHYATINWAKKAEEEGLKKNILRLDPIMYVFLVKMHLLSICNEVCY